MKVLSGSSIGKISRNAVTATARLMMGRPYRRGRRRRTSRGTAEHPDPFAQYAAGVSLPPPDEPETAMSRRYAYLGPAGTFTEMALRRLCEGAPAGEVEAVPTGSVDAALAALREGSVDAAVVPIENSVEGGVSATLDAL